jgi:hypothetical protein
MKPSKQNQTFPCHVGIPLRPCRSVFWAGYAINTSGGVFRIRTREKRPHLASVRDSIYSDDNH